MSTWYERNKEEQYRRNKEWKKKENSPVGDYVTFYNQVARELKYSKLIYKKFILDKPL